MLHFTGQGKSFELNGQACCNRIGTVKMSKHDAGKPSFHGQKYYDQASNQRHIVDLPDQ